MTIKAIPKQERPRERLIAHGAPSLSNTELLAIIIGSGARGLSALDIAASLLKCWPQLSDLKHAEVADICAIQGVNLATYSRIQAMHELASRQLYEQVSRGQIMENPIITRQFLIAKLRHIGHEVFAVLFLDNAHRLIRYEELFQGTINGASVYPRRVLQRAMQLNAAALILAHNHPSGIAEPSHADRQITQSLVKAMALVDIRVLDHFVIGASEAVSFAERGLI